MGGEGAQAVENGLHPDSVPGIDARDEEWVRAKQLDRENRR